MKTIWKEKLAKIELTSTALHIMAMVFMLCDHLWGTIVSGNDWLTCIGRLAFPMYAFFLVEGYFHTKNLKRYVLRLLVFAVLSEIPFNLAMGSSAFYPIHQNVLWSFLISLGLIHWNEKARATGTWWKRLLVGAASVLVGYIVGLLTMVDFYQSGVMMVLLFYFLRGRAWWKLLGQLVGMVYINTEMIKGIQYELSLFGETFYVGRQAFALLALIPLWLYRGKQGPTSKGFRYFCYLFYPLHLLILGLINSCL